MIDRLLQTLSPTATPGPTPSPIGGTGVFDASWWQLLGAFGILIGIAAGIQQLASFLTGLGERRATQRVLEMAAAQLEAEDLEKSVASARADAERLRDVRNALLTEVRERIPREARRAYLENRLDQLAAAISTQVREFEALSAEARALGAAPDRISLSLSPAVRAAVHERTRRRGGSFERTVLALFAVLVVALATPYPLTEVLYEFFRAIYFADRGSVSQIVVLLLIDATLAFFVWTLLSHVSLGRTRPIQRLQGSRGRARVKVYAVVTTLAAGALALGTVLSVRAANINPSVCYLNCESDQPAYEYRAELAAAQEPLRMTANFAFHVGAASAGLGAFLFLSRDAAGLRRQLRRRQP